LMDLHRLDEAKQEMLRALQLDPRNASNYWMLSRIDYARGDLVEAAIWGMKESPLDPADPETPADTAITLDEIGEKTAADGWLVE